MNKEELFKALPSDGVDALFRYYEGYTIEVFHVWCIEGSPRSYKIVVRHNIGEVAYLDFLTLFWSLKEESWILEEDASKFAGINR